MIHHRLALVLPFARSCGGLVHHVLMSAINASAAYRDAGKAFFAQVYRAQPMSPSSLTNAVWAW